MLPVLGIQNKTDKNPYPHGIYILEGDKENFKSKILDREKMVNAL